VKASANAKYAHAVEGTAADVSQACGVAFEQTAYLEAKVRWYGDQEVPGLHAGALLWVVLPFSTLAGAQGRVPTTWRLATINA
jgi:hypothetical protein